MPPTDSSMGTLGPCGAGSNRSITSTLSRLRDSSATLLALPGVPFMPPWMPNLVATTTCSRRPWMALPTTTSLVKGP